VKDETKLIKLLGKIEYLKIRSVRLFNEMGKKFMVNGKNKIIK